MREPFFLEVLASHSKLGDFRQNDLETGNAILWRLNVLFEPKNHLRDPVLENGKMLDAQKFYISIF